jgi:hypothetical protein
VVEKKASGTRFAKEVGVRDPAEVNDRIPDARHLIREAPS